MGTGKSTHRPEAHSQSNPTQANWVGDKGLTIKTLNNSPEVLKCGSLRLNFIPILFCYKRPYLKTNLSIEALLID